MRRCTDSVQVREADVPAPTPICPHSKHDAVLPAQRVFAALTIGDLERHLKYNSTALVGVPDWVKKIESTTHVKGMVKVQSCYLIERIIEMLTVNIINIDITSRGSFNDGAQPPSARGDVFFTCTRIA